MTQADDICSLPKERGPCDKYELRFYYNSDTKECKYFFWGGCEGNGNNFETAEACQSACGVGKGTAITANITPSLNSVSQHNIPRTFAQSSGPIKTIPGVRIGNGTVPPATHEEIEDFTEAPITAAPTTFVDFHNTETRSLEGQLLDLFLKPLEQAPLLRQPRGLFQLQQLLPFLHLQQQLQFHLHDLLLHNLSCYQVTSTMRIAVIFLLFNTPFTTIYCCKNDLCSGNQSTHASGRTQFQLVFFKFVLIVLH